MTSEASYNSSYYSTLDLESAFFQIPLRNEDQELIAFAATGTALFQYRVVPMGCSASEAILQSAVTEVLHEFHCNGAVVYMDDVLIYNGKTRAEQLNFVEKILKVLKAANVTIKLRKVTIGRQKIKFLGMNITPCGWQIRRSFVQTVETRDVHLQYRN